MQPIQYVVRGSAGMCGTDWIQLVPIQPFQTEESIMAEYEGYAWDHFWDYNDEDDFQDIEPEVDYYVEEYNPDEHDGLLS